MSYLFLRKTKHTLFYHPVDMICTSYYLWHPVHTAKKTLTYYYNRYKEFSKFKNIKVDNIWYIVDNKNVF